MVVVREPIRRRSATNSEGDLFGCPKRSVTRRVEGQLTGVSMIVSAVVAHGSAGGGWPTPRMALVLGAVALATCVLSGCVRWSFPRLLCALGVSQFGLHLLMSEFHAAAPAMSSQVSMSHQMVGGAGWSMPVAHTMVTAIAAVSIRYGSRWIVEMPGLIGMVCSPPIAIHLATLASGHVIAIVANTPVSSNVHSDLRSRGPPMSVVAQLSPLTSVGHHTHFPHTSH